MQKEIDKWIHENTTGYWPPLSMMARLTEETGELSRVLNHVYGMKKKKENEVLNSIEEELGDLLYTIVCIANKFDIDLDHAYDKTLKKYSIRDKDRFK